MNEFLQEYLNVLSNYAGFSGRARRKEYWSFVLVNLVIMLAIGVVAGVLKFLGFLSPLYSLAVLVPSLAVSVRRLHDIGKSGWWVLIGLVPLLGLIVMIIFTVKEGDHGPNAYGEDPKAAE